MAVPGFEGLKDVPIEAIPITLREIEQEYCKVANITYPIKDMPFVRSWMVFRVSILV